MSSRGRGRQKVKTNVAVEERKIVGVEDMVLLPKVTTEAIVDNLEKRYKSGNTGIYSYIGDVCVVCNPFQYFRIYDASYVKMHEGANRTDLAPHIFAVAESAFRGMVMEEDKQCVIISGESGAGKTEAAKQIMSYIAAVSGSGGNDQAVTEVKNIILDSNPVLEAMGNAMTLRNNNSSRFGKYFALKFDLSNGGTPRGGIITNYLLEKSRIVRPGPGERTFHIFYQLLAGATPEMQRDLALGRPEHYNVLRISGETIIDNPGGRVDDAKEFEETLRSMETVGIFPEDQRGFFTCIAAVLHLSNIEFTPANVEGADGSRVKDPQTLANAANILGVDASAMEYAICKRTLTTMAAGGGVEQYQVPQNPDQAMAARDALAKDLYARMFNYLIARVNMALEKTGGNTRASIRNQSRLLQDLENQLSIGVLDIYGFEIFDRNGFEQFCINYVNEKLQQIFIELTIRSEQEDYQAEGIAWTPIPFFDNKIVCDLVEGKKPPGIFAILDDTVKTTFSKGATDDKFLEKLNSFQKGHAHFDSFRGGFTILHYAGKVQYTVDGFVESNKDVLSQDMQYLAKSSTVDFIQELYPEEVDVDERRQPTSAGHKIKTQCGDLVYTLMDCTPHYVRCIKSNDEKKAGLFDIDRVKHQVMYLGLLENVKVRRAGFAYRTDFYQFIGRFKPLGAGKMDAQILAHGTDRDITQELVRVAAEAIPELNRQGEVQLGKTKIFIKTPETLFKLQEARKASVNHLVVKIQNVFRRFNNRRELVYLRVEMSELWEANGKEATPSDLLRPYLGTYIEEEDTKLQLSDILEFYQSSEINQERIEYSEKLYRLDKNKKWQQTIFALTDQALYLCQWTEIPPDPKAVAEAKKQKRKIGPSHRLDLLRRTSLKDLEAVYLSHMADDVITIMCTPQEKIKPDKSQWPKPAKVPRCMETQEKFSFFGKKRYQCHYTGNVYVKDVMVKMPLPDLGFFQPVDVHNSTEGMVSVFAREDIVLLTEKKAELTAVLRDLVTRAKGGKATKGPAVPATPEVNVPRAKALYDYEPQQSDELAVKEGDVIELIDTSNADWWMGAVNGKQGLFPAVYVEKLKGGGPQKPKRANARKGFKLDVVFADQYSVRAAPFKGLSDCFGGKLEFKKDVTTTDVRYQNKSGKYVVSVPPGVAGQRVKQIQQAQQKRAEDREAERQRLYELRQQNAAQREAERAAERERKLEQKKAKKRTEREKRQAEEQNRTFATRNAQGTGASFAARLAGQTQQKEDSPPPWVLNGGGGGAPVAPSQAGSSGGGSGAPPPWLQKAQPTVQPAQRRDENFRKQVMSMSYEKSQVSKPPAPPNPKKTTVWEAYKDDDSGDVYYYNKETGHTQWEKPPGFQGEVIA